MSLEHEYIRSELRERFLALQKRHRELQSHLRNAHLDRKEDVLMLQSRLSPQLTYAQNAIEVVLLQLDSFDSADDVEWGELRDATEREWNRLSDIIEGAEHRLRYEEDAAELDDGRDPRDVQERAYSVSGRI